jgi:hypothetical protein
MVEHCPFKAGVLGSSPSRLNCGVFYKGLGGLRFPQRGLVAATKPDDNSPLAPFGGEGPEERGSSKTLLKKQDFTRLQCRPLPELAVRILRTAKLT